MKKHFSVLIAFWLLGFISHEGKGQEVISAGGGFIENAGITVSWTLGEMVTETFRSEDKILTQGFHQTEYSVVSVKDLAELEFPILVYPNPAGDFINLKVENPELENLYVSIYDFQGAVKKKSRLNGALSRISLSDLPPAVYFIRIFDESQNSKTIKIIKK